MKGAASALQADPCKPVLGNERHGRVFLIPNPFFRSSNCWNSKLTAGRTFGGAQDIGHPVSPGAQPP